MTALVAQIAPQRSTQYADLATVLAPYEMKLSPVGHQIAALTEIKLGGQNYLNLSLPTVATTWLDQAMTIFATVSAFFEYYDQVGEQAGPFLKPIETTFTPALSPDLITTRRYRGKTNELFTHFLCNIAKFSSDFATHPWSDLRLFDPLAGGGTTLLTGLVLGAIVAGVDHNLKDIQSTVAFLKQFAREERLACSVKQHRLKQVGQRWVVSLGRKEAQQCLLASGETYLSKQLTGGFKPHLIVTDLPYGVQHQGQLSKLLTPALEVWAAMLASGGVLTFAWESTRFPRIDMIAYVESASPLQVLKASPYDALTHRVDRVIKQRDIIVAQHAI